MGVLESLRHMNLKVVDEIDLRCVRYNPEDEYCLLICHGGKDIKLAKGDRAMELFDEIADTFKSNTDGDSIGFTLCHNEGNDYVDGKHISILYRENDDKEQPNKLRLLKEEDE